MRCRTDTNPVTTTLISGVNIPQNQAFRPKIPPMILELLRTRNKPVILTGRSKSRGTQSKFRETETQTDPFTPEIKKPYRPGLEVLTLSWLSWNNGLPAGMREVTVIERARQKKAWLLALPPPFNATTNGLRSMILEAIELNEWQHREIEISAINSVRLELARKCVEENLSANRIKYENRLLKYMGFKMEEKEAALEKARHDLKRSLRRLTYKFENEKGRPYRWNAWQQLKDKSSWWYKPQQSSAHHSRILHEVIPKEFRYWNVFSHGETIGHGMEVMVKTEKITFDYINKSKARKITKHLCDRETKWTLDELERLWYSVVRMRGLKTRTRTKSLNIRKNIVPREGPLILPAIAHVTNEEDENYQAALTLQKIIKGRAIQSVMFVGRAGRQSVIEEMKSTVTIHRCMEDSRSQRLQMVYNRRRRAEVKFLEDKRKDEILRSLEGRTVADILDFLAKELTRIQNERETHAIILMAEKARREKETLAKGGQPTEDLRREQNEIWKQICKVFQSSVDMEQQEYILYTVKKFSKEEARKEATEYAKRIDQAATEAHLRRNELEEQEIIADLVYNFALPQTEKEMVRERLKEKHRSLLATCHDEIYSRMEMLVRGSRTSSGRLIPMARPEHRTSGESTFIKYMKLTRASGTSILSPSKSTLYDSVRSWQKSMQGSEFVDSERWSTGFSPQKVVIE